MKKADKCIYDSYKRSWKTRLRECYATFSNKKDSAFEHCQELMRKHDGHGLKIISANAYQFTAGFLYEENGKNYLMYISKATYENGMPILLDD